MRPRGARRLTGRVVAASRPPSPPTRRSSSPPAEMERLVRLAMDRIVDARRRRSPRSRRPTPRGPRALARELIEREPPETGAPAEELLDLLFDRAIPKSFNTASPGYLAYIPGGGLFHVGRRRPRRRAPRTATSASSRPRRPSSSSRRTSSAGSPASPAFPEAAGGYLASGGSLANFSAVVAARRERLPEDFLSGVLYVSDQTHHCVAKAAVLAGFPPRSVREIPSDETFRIRLDLLERPVAEDRKKGPHAVPRRRERRDDEHRRRRRSRGPSRTSARRERLWFHVDAAYGGFFLLTERGRRAMAGIERADSVVLDPHKGLFLPYGTGCLLVRDAAGAPPRPRRRRPTTSRGCRATPTSSTSARSRPSSRATSAASRVWLPLKMHGLGPFRRNLDEKLDLARWAAGELAAPPRRRDRRRAAALAPRLPGRAGRRLGPALDALNRRLLAAVNARGRVHLTGTTAKGRFVLRICVLSFRTHRRPDAGRARGPRRRRSRGRGINPAGRGIS